MQLSYNFKLRNHKAKKETPVIVYISFGSSSYKRIKYYTGNSIHPDNWADANPKSKKQRAHWPKVNEADNKNLITALEELEGAIKRLYDAGTHPDKFRRALDVELSKKSVLDHNLNSYITEVIRQCTEGERLTKKKGIRYTPGTLKNMRQFQARFNEFQDETHQVIDFEDVRQKFYNEFERYYRGKGYSVNGVGKLVKQLKFFMNAAYAEKIHKNDSFRDILTVKTQEVKNVFLNEDELATLYEMDLSTEPHLDKVRDVFLVGCYTAQRYSDYHAISQEMIEDGILELIQQKTKTTVKIPVRPEVVAILDKWGGSLPKTYDQKINKYIKTICKEAGITKPIQHVIEKDGREVHTRTPKWKMIMSHTARRSGCTNLYYAQPPIPMVEIMKISGHKTETEFLNYVKPEEDEVAKRLKAHPYFVGQTLKAVK